MVDMYGYFQQNGATKHTATDDYSLILTGTTFPKTKSLKRTLIMFGIKMYLKIHIREILVQIERKNSRPWQPCIT